MLKQARHFGKTSPRWQEEMLAVCSAKRAYMLCFALTQLKALFIALFTFWRFGAGSCLKSLRILCDCLNLKFQVAQCVQPGVHGVLAQSEKANVVSFSPLSTCEGRTLFTLVAIAKAAESQRSASLVLE